MRESKDGPRHWSAEEIKKGSRFWSAEETEARNIERLEARIGKLHNAKVMMENGVRTTMTKEHLALLLQDVTRRAKAFNREMAERKAKAEKGRSEPPASDHG